MRRAEAGLLLWVLAASLVVGCSRSKEGLIQTSRDVGTRAELERALGRPSDISKLGPVEQWTYKASNGSGGLPHRGRQGHDPGHREPGRKERPEVGGLDRERQHTS